jgi:NCS1 family nucleobase:cation symporter-1
VSEPVEPSGSQADTSAWPLLAHERTWSSWQLGVALVTAAAATWCYIIGEYVGSYLNFFQGVATLAAGSMIGMLLVTLAVIPVCIRFGVDSIATAKPQFGSTGWLIPALMQFVSILGWNSLLLIFFAKSATQLLIALGVIADGSSQLIVPATTALACAIVFIILIKGSSGVDRIAKILVFHVVIGMWMLFILTDERWPELAAAVPAQASPDPLWNYTTGIEIGISSLLSWWPYIGAMVRMAPNGRKAALPIMLGMGAPVPVLSMIGIAGILVLKVSDPAEWLRTVGGPAYGIFALIFVAAANLGTAIAGIYASALGMRHLPGVDKLPWTVLLVITIAPVALVGLFIPEIFFANFGTFLAFIAVGFAPLCGIQITDYYLLRRRQIDIRGIYDFSKDGAYRFWGGVNPAAVIAMAVGVSVYIYLLNPLSYESRVPYQYVTASLPTALAAGLVYALLTKLVVMPSGRGGYRR